MIRIVLVLSLLKLANSSKIPIQKQIVGPGGENINVNIEVDIDLPDDDTTGGVTQGPPTPRTTEAPEKCLTPGEICIPGDECCGGLSFMKSEEYVFPPIHKCRHIHKPPTCLKAFETCSTTRLGRPKCCAGLSCVDSGREIDPPQYFCKKEPKPTEPTCLKT